MKISNIKKALKITILMTVILALPIMYTMATESVISYTLSEDKKSAVIHIDVNKVIGNNDLVEVKDHNNNLLTEYDITVTENGTYSYTVTYKEKVIKETEVVNEETVAENITEETATTTNVEQTTETLEVPEEEIIIKNEILEITVEGILNQEDLSNQQVDAQSVETEKSSVSQNELTSLQTSEVTPTPVDLFTFDEDTKTITAYNGTSTDIVIPETINGVTVEIIGNSVFKNKGITSVVFPDTIKEIDGGAFYNHKLKSLLLPSKLEIIGGSSFEAENISSEEKNTFTDLIIPKSVKYIYGHAFTFNNIKNLTFSEGCELQIGGWVFWHNEIKSVDLSVGNIILNIPSMIGQGGMDGVGHNTFGHNKIESVKFNRYMTEIPTYAFDANNLKTLEIPANIRKIDTWSFGDNEELISVKLNEGVSIIGEACFQNCYKLRHVNIPNSITAIGVRSFHYTAIPCLNIREGMPVYTHTPGGMEVSYASYGYVETTVIKKNNKWTLNLGDLDENFEIDRVENVKNLLSSNKYSELSDIDGVYDYQTGTVTFSSDPTGKGIAYFYRTQKENLEDYTLMKQYIELDNIRILSDVHFDSMNTKEVTVGEVYGELPVPPSRVGYTFKEWNTLSDGTGETITSETIVTNENEHTLYPIFTPISYEVTLIADNHQEVKNVFYDGTYGDLPIIEKSGYDFMGWNTQSDGKGKYVTKDTILDKAENQTLYAIYKKTEESKPDNNQTPDGDLIFPGEDGEIGTSDDIIVKPGTIDDKGNIIIPDGGVIIYPDGNEEDFPNGGIILPGEDGEIGTKDDVIVKDGTIDDKGNIIISSGGEVLYPDGSKEEFPNGGILVPGEDGALGTKDDITVKPAKVDNQGNVIISDEGMIVYPNGVKDSFPNGGMILPGEDQILGTRDDVVVKSATVNNQGNIVISNGGEIFYPDGKTEKLLDGGILYAGLDGIFGTSDDLLIRNIKDDRNSIENPSKNKSNQTSHHVITSDDAQVLLWSFLAVISMTNVIMSVKKRMMKP